MSLLFFPRKLAGREYLPRQGACILACNHVSNLDPFIIGISSPRPLSFVAKEELFRNEISARLLRGMGAFPIKRDTSDFRALRHTLRLLHNGRAVLIFPEGTRQRPGQPQDPQPGIGFVAKKSRAPIIPIFIQGSQIVLPPGQKSLRRHLVTLFFGKPMMYNSDDSAEFISQKIIEAIYALPK